MSNTSAKLTDFSVSQLMELKEYLKDYQINYRYNLGLPQDLTFGIEIEEVGASYPILRSIMNEFSDSWQTDHETSIKQTYGAETNSPVFSDTVETWQSIAEVCHLLSKYGLSVNLETAAHIHFGNAGLIDSDPTKFLNIMKLWAVYEPIIYRFSKGEFSSIRPNAITKYAKPFAKEIKQLILEEGVNDSSYEKLVHDFFVKGFAGLNIENLFYYNTVSDDQELFEEISKYKRLKDTIEVRTPNGTLNPVIWQNNINFFAKLFLYATSNTFDDDAISEKLERLSFEMKVVDKKLRNLTYAKYNILTTFTALELADLIFDNDVDKLNFLKQYVGFEATKKTLEKVKTL